MKIGILADIHANLPALTKALEICQAEGVERFIVAGDILGFYPFPIEVIDLVREQLSEKAWIVAGNHDRHVITGETICDSFSATIAARWQHKILNMAQLKFLSELPEIIHFEFSGLRFLVVHGSPEAPLYGRITSHDMLQPVEADIIVFGHTHLPTIIDKNSARWLNPGSVGQPRDGDTRGSLAILELPSKEMRIIRFPYEIKLVEKKWFLMHEIGLDDRLLRWLYNGHLVKSSNIINER